MIVYREKRHCIDWLAVPVIVFHCLLSFSFECCTKCLTVMVNADQLAWFQGKRGCLFKGDAVCGKPAMEGGLCADWPHTCNTKEDGGQDQRLRSWR